MFRSLSSTWRSLATTLCVFVAAFVLLPSRGEAAGCHYDRQQDGWSSLEADSFHVRLYVDGQLRVFQRVDLPCSGPNCKASKPINFAAPVVPAPDDRSDGAGMGFSGRPEASRIPRDFEFDFLSLYAHLEVVELLRPPRA